MSREKADPLPPERFEEILEGAGPKLRIRLEAAASRGLSRYLSELDRWRRRVNLTGNLTAEELAEHVLESLAPLGLIANGSKLVDIGSGAGLPGLPIAIARPDISATLIEPRERRAAFLRHVVRALGLANVEVVQRRIEEVGGQTFDVATTRAVGGFPSWIGEAAFLEDGGLFLAWTTDPGAVASGIGPRFEAAGITPLPGSERRSVAAFKLRR
ncbi:MAG TPA: 16S rRNA (guanine(527)-N(7))-methyltransferase RsmG [Thermoanaerobaculia bacterium]|nr:16S rRNA (guanine(527)-N(7))-methyltransferase RsmG [Thermoanaerobaculia bacterium]